jgi:hypothetical protein
MLVGGRSAAQLRTGLLDGRKGEVAFVPRGSGSLLSRERVLSLRYRLPQFRLLLPIRSQPLWVLRVRGRARRPAVARSCTPRITVLEESRAGVRRFGRVRWRRVPCDVGSRARVGSGAQPAGSGSVYLRLDCVRQRLPAASPPGRRAAQAGAARPAARRRTALATIHHELSINASAAKVFEALSSADL